MTRAGETAPLNYARVGGILYLYIIVAALFAEVFVRGKLIVRGDAAATAANILGSETLFRVSVAGEALTWLCDIALAMILYVLLKPVSRNWALLAAFYRVTFVAFYAVSKLFLIVAVILLKGETFLKAFDIGQLQALSYLSLRMHGYGYGASLIFFGVHLALVGYLIYRLGYVPRILGVLLLIAGPCYVTHSLLQMLSPALASKPFPWMLLPAFPAELGLCLWLLVKGGNANAPKWEESGAPMLKPC